MQSAALRLPPCSQTSCAQLAGSGLVGLPPPFAPLFSAVTTHGVSPQVSEYWPPSGVSQTIAAARRKLVCTCPSSQWESAKCRFTRLQGLTWNQDSRDCRRVGDVCNAVGVCINTAATLSHAPTGNTNCRVGTTPFGLKEFERLHATAGVVVVQWIVWVLCVATKRLGHAALCKVCGSTIRVEANLHLEVLRVHLHTGGSGHPTGNSRTFGEGKLWTARVGTVADCHWVADIVVPRGEDTLANDGVGLVFKSEDLVFGKVES